MQQYFLTGMAVLFNGAWLRNHGVLLDGDRIAAILPDDANVPVQHVVLPSGSFLAPGLIDIQVNGGGGILFNEDPTPLAARAIAAAHRRLGTTRILPTLITSPPDVFHRAAASAETGEGVLGIHFEGPFLSKARPGVHDPALIRPPDEADFAAIESLARRLDGPVMLTVAPETVDDPALRRLHAAGLKLSAGHSAASFERTEAAILAGITGFTHLFNAMPPPAAREPGIVAAALLGVQTWCGVIADGFHVHPAMLRLLLASCPIERIMLVSDSMPPAGTCADAFMLQGRKIFRRDGRLVTADGTLAGADLCLAEAVRRAVRLMGVTLAQALMMASSAPAAFLDVDDRLGHIAPGFTADLLLLDENLVVLGTWLAGDWQGDEESVLF